MDPKEFLHLVQPITDRIAGNTITSELADALNREFPPGGEQFESINKACHAAIASGWMCAEGGAGRRFASAG